LAPNATDFEVAKKMAEGVGSSNKAVDVLVTGSRRIIAPVLLLHGAYDSYYEINNATNKSYAITKEAGGWVGGAFGATGGTVGAVALGTFIFGATPVGLAATGVVGLSVLGGMMGGVGGSVGGKYAAASVYNEVTTWLKSPFPIQK
jgi:hypothetical protein